MVGIKVEGSLVLKVTDGLKVFRKEGKFLELPSKFNSYLSIYQFPHIRLHQFFDVPKDSRESHELEILVLLVKKYEVENFEETPLPDPINAIKERMEDLGLKAKDLVPAIGDKGTVFKVLNRKIPLSLKMIRNLCPLIGLPAEILIQETRCELA